LFPVEKVESLNSATEFSRPRLRPVLLPNIRQHRSDIWANPSSRLELGRAVNGSDVGF
jgi:hypothetical protein